MDDDDDDGSDDDDDRDDDDGDNDNNDDHIIATTAAYLPLAAFSSTSWKASNIRMVLLNPSAAVLAE